MNNKEIIGMLKHWDGNCITMNMTELLDVISKFPEDMRTPEMKRLISAGEAFVGKLVEDMQETIDCTGITKQINHKWSAHPDGSIYRTGYMNRMANWRIKPWEPSKKAKEELERLQVEHSKTSVMEQRALQAEYAAEKKAKKIEREQAKERGEIRLPDIKYASLSLHWQLRQFMGKDNRFPVNNGTPLAERIQVMKEVNDKAFDARVNGAKAKADALNKLLVKLKDNAYAFVKKYDIAAKVFPRALHWDASKEIEIFITSYWATIIPGREQEFINIFQRLAATAYKINKKLSYGWQTKYSVKQTDIIMSIIKCSKGKSFGHIFIGEHYEAMKDDVVACSKLIEFSENVEKAIFDNNPDAPGLKPYVRELLFRMNVFGEKKKEAVA